jgi:hypothetical protein
VIILVIVGAVIVTMLAVFGVFKPSSPNEHTISFRVSGTTSTAVITHTTTDGKASEPFEVAVPWHKSVKFPKGSVVILTAGNPTQTGSIECRLTLDGKDWKHDTTNSPGDKVSCAGIVP